MLTNNSTATELSFVEVHPDKTFSACHFVVSTSTTTTTTTTCCDLNCSRVPLQQQDVSAASAELGFPGEGGLPTPFFSSELRLDSTPSLPFSSGACPLPSLLIVA
jgi:hypothetical protein